MIELRMISEEVESVPVPGKGRMCVFFDDVAQMRARLSDGSFIELVQRGEKGETGERGESGALAVYPVRVVSESTTLTQLDSIIFFTGSAAATFMLPTVSISGRIFSITNQGSAPITLSSSVTTFANSTTNSIQAGASLRIVSDGLTWRRTV